MAAPFPPVAQTFDLQIDRTKCIIKAFYPAGENPCELNKKRLLLTMFS